ncbi:putative pre-mRNA-splicing factor ATP-dependent RNA helicase DHX16 [Symbiodinium microadriaticum]|uniref:RNA helicase n=1 Tax=Symbiodinium microadriaticum TaxID=2951 RepID=A0A1Q9C6E4_SYMMI|nr:putative pre-mRNA-splicing factor ATP-dependent RNA helicase DHX16 [Symbiodinium microadriaticum]
MNSAIKAPEIQRSNLGHVVLMLKSIGIDDLLHFDFMDPPPPETLIKALEQLYALSALNDQGDLTKLGRRMAEFPMDPQQSKSLIQADKYKCVDEVVTICSMLGVDGAIFYRPKDKGISSFQLTGVRWEETGYSLNWCMENYLQNRSLKRARDIRDQLVDMLEKVEIEHSSNVQDLDGQRKSILSGFFYNTARLRKDGSYVTVKHPHTVEIHPTSCLFGQQPKLVCYHELVLTTKEFMRSCIEVKPEWLLEVAPHFYQSKVSKSCDLVMLYRLIRSFEAFPWTGGSHEVQTGARREDSRDYSQQAPQSRLAAQESTASAVAVAFDGFWQGYIWAQLDISRTWMASRERCQRVRAWAHRQRSVDRGPWHSRERVSPQLSGAVRPRKRRLLGPRCAAAAPQPGLKAYGEAYNSAKIFQSRLTDNGILLEKIKSAKYRAVLVTDGIGYCFNPWHSKARGKATVMVEWGVTSFRFCKHVLMLTQQDVNADALEANGQLDYAGQAGSGEDKEEEEHKEASPEEVGAEDALEADLRGIRFLDTSSLARYVDSSPAVPDEAKKAFRLFADDLQVVAHRLSLWGRIVTRLAVEAHVASHEVLQSDLQRHAEKIAASSLRPPVVVVGLPRTGTTLLHHLLALDPDTQCLRAFELLRPARLHEIQKEW